MKVIFLDIDGVLNSRHRLLKQKKKDPSFKVNAFTVEDHKLKLLKHIVESTDSCVILSSSWRFGKTGYLESLLSSYNIVVVGSTCDGVSLDYRDKRCKTWYLDEEGNGYTHDKGAEILKYINNHKKITNYVVLDDEEKYIEEWIPKEHFVKTAFHWGLTENKALQVISKLNSNS